MTNKPTLKEPFVRLAKRDRISTYKSIGIRLIAVVVALVIDALFIFFVTKLNPISVYAVMFEGTFSNSLRFAWAMRDLVSLLCIAIALAPAFKMKFWNIGAEGQVLMGGLATSYCMITYGDSLPTPLLFLVMFVTSVTVGALWAFLPAFFKAKFNTNETLFTLMMNYVAIQIVACFTNIMRGDAAIFGKINVSSMAGWFPQIGGHRFMINIIVVLLLTLIMYIYLKFTKQGYEISVVGESVNTARYAGINVNKVIIRTMLISGAICGLNGFLAVAGKDQTISINTAGGYGFTAIIVAWLSKFNTFTMVAVSFLLIFLEKGATEIASKYNLNDYMSDIIAGIILFCILGCEFFVNYKLIFAKKAKGESK